jgi:hypothetical protein
MVVTAITVAIMDGIAAEVMMTEVMVVGNVVEMTEVAAVITMVIAK